jgi:hypothetical protein
MAPEPLRLMAGSNVTSHVMSVYSNVTIARFSPLVSGMDDTMVARVPSDAQQF